MTAILMVAAAVVTFFYVFFFFSSTLFYVFVPRNAADISCITQLPRASRHNQGMPSELFFRTILLCAQEANRRIIL